MLPFSSMVLFIKTWWKRFFQLLHMIPRLLNFSTDTVYRYYFWIKTNFCIHTFPQLINSKLKSSIAILILHHHQHQPHHHLAPGLVGCLEGWCWCSHRSPYPGINPVRVDPDIHPSFHWQDFKCISDKQDHTKEGLYAAINLHILG